MNWVGWTFTIIFVSLILFLFFRFFLFFFLKKFTYIHKKRNIFAQLYKKIFGGLKSVKIIQFPEIKEKYSILRDKTRVESEFTYNSNSKNFFIMVHGLSRNKEDFKGFFNIIKKKGHSCLIWSSRKWSSDKKIIYHVDTLTNDIYDLIKAVNKQFPRQKIILVGHSLGALLLTELIRHYPDLNKNIKLVLINYPTSSKIRYNSFYNFDIKGTFHFIKGLLSNKNIPISLKLHIPKNSKIDKATSTEVKERSTFPLYFFINIWNLSSKTLTNLQSDKKHLILITLGMMDSFADLQKIIYQRELLSLTNPNIVFWIRSFASHDFADSSKKSELFFEELIERTLDKKKFLKTFS